MSFPPRVLRREHDEGHCTKAMVVDAVVMVCIEPPDERDLVREIVGGEELRPNRSEGRGRVFR